jgi:hypothetical protein
MNLLIKLLKKTMYWKPFLINMRKSKPNQLKYKEFQLKYKGFQVKYKRLAQI